MPVSSKDDEIGLGPRELAEKRLERQRRTMEGYKQWARYPPGSRPLSEQPDLQKPHAVARSTQPLVGPDEKLTNARVTLEQDRLYLVGDESARFRISCATSKGPAPCEVTSAAALIPPDDSKAGTIGPIPVAFAADGGEGTVGALFAPAKEGFSSHHGLIAVDVQLRIGEEAGSARFNVIYTPAAPARFTGKVREALEEGSVCLYVQMAIERGGRYVLAARVDDADGDGFAYLEYNDVLEAGLQEPKMCVFGLLVLDERAKAPFVLRDVEGFLLLEDQSPDREIVPTLEGPVYTTKAYDDGVFANAEWQSEEKTRNVTEFENGVRESEKELETIESGAGP
jgi:hypothetical protein